MTGPCAHNLQGASDWLHRATLRARATGHPFDASGFTADNLRLTVIAERFGRLPIGTRFLAITESWDLARILRELY